MTVITAESLAGGSEPDVISKNRQEQDERQSHSSHECTRVDKSSADLTTPCDEQFTFVQGSAISSCDTSTTPSTTSLQAGAYDEEEHQSAVNQQSGQLQHYEQCAPRNNNEDEGNETGDEEGSRNSTSHSASFDADDVHLTSSSINGCGSSFAVKGLAIDSPPPLPTGLSGVGDGSGQGDATDHIGHSGQHPQRRKERKCKEKHRRGSGTATVGDDVAELNEDQGQLNDQGYSHQVSSSISMEEASLSSTLTVHSTNSASVLSTSTTTSHREGARKTGQITTACGSFSSINGNNNGKNNNCNNGNNNGSSSNSSRSSSQVGGGGGTNTRSSGSNSSQNKRHSGSSETSISGVSNKNGIHIASNNSNNNNGIICSSGDLLYESMVENAIPARNSTPVASSYSSSPAPPPLPPLLPSMTGTPKVLHSARVHQQQQGQLHHQQPHQQQHLYPQEINDSPNATFASTVQNSIGNCTSATSNDIHTDNRQNGNNVNGNDSTIKKGLLWQMKDGGFFSRWKERYFILTKDYLTCFKKSSSNLSFLGSEMGSFSYKLKLVEVDSINWKSPSDCTGRSKMIPKSIRNKNKKNQKTRRVNSSFSSGGVSSDGDSGNECGNDHEHHNYLRYFSGDTTDGSNASRYNLDDHSSSCRSSNSSRKSSSKASNGREVISISIKNGSSHIDLWTWCDSSLDDWMNCLREASNHSKGRREALIRKSKTLCVPSPNHQPFALTSYWATASRYV